MKAMGRIRLHQFAPAFGLPNASPFCMKVETYLRMAGLPWEAVNDGDVLKAPKKKLPYIKDGDRVVADSSFIIDPLKATRGDALDDWLDASQRGVALAFQRLFEEHLYWAAVYTRWIDDTAWPQTREAFFAALPAPLRWILPPLARRGLRVQLQGQGLGRHSAAEIHALGVRDITAVADFLADKPFLMGERPCSLDATGHAFLANLLWAPVDSPLRDAARRHPNLAAYCERMKARYFA